MSGAHPHTPEPAAETGDPLQPQAAISDASLLLEHAVSTGRLPEGAGEVATANSDMVRRILTARASDPGALSTDQAVDFWLAFDRLAKLVRPVTAQSIRSSRRVSLVQMKLSATLTVGAVIVLSIFLFMCNSTLNETSTLIDQQNEAALKLWSDVQTLSGATLGRTDDGDNMPAEGPQGSVAVERVFDDMVEFSRKNAWLLQSSSRLNYWFTPFWMRLDPAPVVFNKDNKSGLTHLNVPPDLNTIDQIKAEAIYQVRVYQTIRDYALGLTKINTLLYSSLSTYFLPTVYALLGAFLYGFRTYSRLIRRKEYLRSAARSARYYIAAIAGLVVGLLGSMLPKDVTLPPLAVAFLFGYAVEAFFSRLDDVINKLKAEATQAAAKPPAEAAEPAE